MKKAAQFVFGVALGLALASSQAVLGQGRNEISGTVFGESGRPVADVYVELITDLGSSLTRLRTNASGRFTFSGLTNGRFTVRILPYGTDYREQTQDVILGTVRPDSSDRQQIQIYLTLNTRARSGPFAIVAGVVFAQEVPRAAQDLYDQGVRLLAEKKEEKGLNKLRQSIEIFPTYYLALDRLGAEYAVRGLSDRSYLEAGLVLLSKASEVNPRSFSSAFGLGWVQYHLGLMDDAVTNLRRATTMYGKAAEAYLWLGKALKRKAALDQAEAALQRANQLAKGKSAEVHWQMAGLYNQQKRYKEAADEFELFLKIQPKSTDAEKIRELIKQLRAKAANQT
jgi:Flp pilus assembly protein TadD